MAEDAAQIVAPIVQSLEDGWNAGDAQSFGAAFADDADFVDIRADYHQGQEAIAFGHRVILESIYHGSQNKYTLVNARQLTPDVIVAQVSAVLQVPAGPLAGENRSLFTMVLCREASAWKIAAFQNTMVPPNMAPDEQQVRDQIR